MEMRKWIGLTLIILFSFGLSGCAATIWGGKSQDTQVAIAESNVEDTEAIAEAIKAFVADGKMSSEGKIAALALGMMAYQSKQHGKLFRAQTWNSPIEENFVQALMTGVMGLFVNSGRGQDRLIEKSEKSSEKVTTTVTTTSSEVTK